MTALRRVFESLGFSGVAMFAGVRFTGCAARSRARASHANVPLARILRRPFTIRGARAVKMMAAKYAPAR